MDNSFKTSRNVKSRLENASGIAGTTGQVDSSVLNSRPNGSPDINDGGLTERLKKSSFTNLAHYFQQRGINNNTDISNAVSMAAGKTPLLVSSVIKDLSIDSPDNSRQQIPNNHNFYPQAQSRLSQKSAVGEFIIENPIGA